MLDPHAHARVVAFMEEALERSLDRYREQFPHIGVEVGSFERHERFIPAIAELMRREDARGTKGMSNRNQSMQAMSEQISWELGNGRAVLLLEHDELFGYATLATWENDDAKLTEFCSAVVDETFRGLGMGRVLVDAREILAVAQLVPQGYRPIAFCNAASARIYNRDLWFQAPWEWYRGYPPPITCKTECSWDRVACDCVVLMMDLEKLAELAGVASPGIKV